jgi:hypothetical protein
MKTVTFNVYDFVDGGIDYGFFVGANLEGFAVNGEVDAQNDEINDVFGEFGIELDFRSVALVNGGYIDTWYSTTLKRDVDEYFFKNKKDAEAVAKMLQDIMDSVLV